MPHVDAGDGWLIFGLPDSEIAVHPANKNNTHEIFFIVKDLKEFVSEMEKLKIKCSTAQDLGWGILTHVTLPGGGKLGFYQAHHPRPRDVLDRKRKSNKTGRGTRAEKRYK